MAAAKKAAPAKKASYVGNVVKEVKQTVKAVSNAVDKADRKKMEDKTGRKIDIKIGKSNIKAQVGQAAGAVLQGRRYDNATGKQIKATSSAAEKAKSKPKTKKPALETSRIGGIVSVPKKVKKEIY